MSVTETWLRATDNAAQELTDSTDEPNDVPQLGGRPDFDDPPF
ncbi:hypothetical protein [Rhodococcus erythropolis]